MIKTQTSIIISCLGSAPHKLAKTLAKFLTPLLEIISLSHLKNSGDLIFIALSYVSACVCMCFVKKNRQVIYIFICIIFFNVYSEHILIL